MGHVALGAFSSTPLGIVIAESKLTLARALLASRHTRFAQRPTATRGSPEKILRRSEDLGTANV